MSKLTSSPKPRPKCYTVSLKCDEFTWEVCTWVLISPGITQLPSKSISLIFFFFPLINTSNVTNHFSKRTSKFCDAPYKCNLILLNKNCSTILREDSLTFVHCNDIAIIQQCCHFDFTIYVITKGQNQCYQKVKI